MHSVQWHCSGYDAVLPDIVAQNRYDFVAQNGYDVVAQNGYDIVAQNKKATTS